MASEITFYSSFFKYILDGTIDLDTDVIKVMLVTSDYTPDTDHTVKADIHASPDPEVAAIESPDNGYIEGGEALTGVAVTYSSTPSQAKLDAEDVVWTALAATFRYGILYVEKTISSPAIVNPLIAYLLFDTTPADTVVSGVDWSIIWSANGVFTLA